MQGWRNEMWGSCRLKECRLARLARERAIYVRMQESDPSAPMAAVESGNTAR